MRYLLLLFLGIELLSAHRLNLFAYREGEKVVVSSYFASGSPCQNCDVTLMQNGTPVAAGTTDDQGEAIIKAPAGPLTVQVNAGGGHGATQTLDGEAPAATPQEPASSSAAVDDARLRQIVEEAVAVRIRPLVLQIEQQQSTPLEKIIAALGYLLGVFGLWMLWRRR